MKIKNRNEKVKRVSLWSQHKPQESLKYQIKTFLDPLLKPFSKSKIKDKR